MLHETELGWRVGDAKMGDILAYAVCHEIAAFLRGIKPIDVDTTPSHLLRARLGQEVLTHAHYLKVCRGDLPAYLVDNPAIASNMDGLADLADMLVTDEVDAQRLAVLVSSSAVVAAASSAMLSQVDGREAVKEMQATLKKIYSVHAKQWAARAHGIIDRYPQLPRKIERIQVRKDPVSGDYGLHVLREDL